MMETMKLLMSKWMLGHDAENTAHEKWENTTDILEGKFWQPRDWGTGLDLNIDNEEPPKVHSTDSSVPMESAVTAQVDYTFCRL